MIEGWLAKRIGSGQMNVATGNIDRNTKYEFKPSGYRPDIAAYIQGNINHLYGSCPALPDGTTYLLAFDIDASFPDDTSYLLNSRLTKGFDSQRLAAMQALALNGIASVCWRRRPGRWHLEIYFDKPVNPREAYKWIVSVCPYLVNVLEVFPLDLTDEWSDRNFSSLPLTWPLWYRIGNHVHECAAEIMLPGYQLPMLSTGIESDRERLTWLLSQAVTSM